MSNLALSPKLDVYIGSWTNWSYGRIFGATLTLPQRDGNLLIAFIALFVTFVGTCSFRLACFAFHRIFSTQGPRDAVYHQRQAILRNSANGVTALWQMSQLLWTWRGRASHIARRVLPVILYIGVNVLAFAICGVLSSNIAAMTGQEVLLKENTFCGGFDLKRGPTFNDLTAVMQPFEAKKHLSAFNYAQDCYAAQSHGGPCGSYVKSRLPSTVDRNASCPFKSEMCRTPDKNLKLDTGLLNSNHHFGVNAPDHKTVSIRRILHCGPLVTDGYSQQPNRSTSPDTRYYYGHQQLMGEYWFDYTFEHTQSYMNERTEQQGLIEGAEYDIGISKAFRRAGKERGNMSNFAPIQALERSDADVFIIFLSANNVQYIGPIDDYWFAAHRKGYMGGFSLDKSRGQQLYMADEAASPLGCALQYQTCLPNRRCSSIGTVGDMLEPARTIPSSTPEEQARVQQIWSALEDAPQIFSMGLLGTVTLMVKYSLMRGFQVILPDNQWQLEIERWHNVTSAGYHETFVRQADGLDETIRPIYEIVRDASTEYMCKNQKIRSTAYANFSIFGLAFIFTVGGIIIFLSYMLEAFAFASLIRLCSRNRNKKTPYQQLEWCANGTFQLQRLAQEELGYGEWEKCDQEIPVTKEPCVLAALNVDDPTHPTLGAAAFLPKPITSQVASNNSDNEAVASEDNASGLKASWLLLQRIPRS